MTNIFTKVERNDNMELMREHHSNAIPKKAKQRNKTEKRKYFYVCECTLHTLKTKYRDAKREKRRRTQRNWKMNKMT